MVMLIARKFNAIRREPCQDNERQFKMTGWNGLVFWSHVL